MSAPDGHIYWDMVDAMGSTIKVDDLINEILADVESRFDSRIWYRSAEHLHRVTNQIREYCGVDE